MAATAAVFPPPVPPQVIANAFVQQYYQLLHRSPDIVYRFYEDISKLGRPEDDGSMSITTTMEAINLKILSLDYGGFKAEIKSVDAQESMNGGVDILVTGSLTGKDNILRNFAQSFFLAPQEKGYFVLNDMFRYLNIVSGDTDISSAMVEPPVTPVQDIEITQVEESDISEEGAVVSEGDGEEVLDVMENEEVNDLEEEAPAGEVVDEVQDASEMAIDSSIIIEEVPKKSYASIVMELKESSVPFLSPIPSPRKSQPRNQEQQMSPPPSLDPAVKAVARNVDPIEFGGRRKVERYSIYIRGLPTNATHAIVEEAFKEFGPIKNGGIQVKNRLQESCFGFVEFEVADAVHKAIEASPLTINGRRVIVQEKRSTNSGGNRGRFPVGRGFEMRNEDQRGRAPYSGTGRGYDRGDDFNGVGRTDFGYRSGIRGGSSHRGRSDGYQRADNGGRMSRATNGNSRNMAPQIPATA